MTTERAACARRKVSAAAAAAGGNTVQNLASCPQLRWPGNDWGDDDSGRSGGGTNFCAAAVLDSFLTPRALGFSVRPMSLWLHKTASKTTSIREGSEIEKFV